MFVRWIFLIIVLMLFVSFSNAHAQNKIKSGPSKGEFLPKPFHPLNINGKFGTFTLFDKNKVQQDKNITYKGRYHSLLCEYGLQPVALIFTKEDRKEADTQLTKLLLGIDKAIGEDPDGFLRGFVVYLSPAARTSVTEATKAEDKRINDPAVLNADAMSFDLLYNRLKKRADKFQQVIVTTYPLKLPMPPAAYVFSQAGSPTAQFGGPMARVLPTVVGMSVSDYAKRSVGPAGFQIDADAEITIILYKAHRIQESMAFLPGELNDENSREVLNKIRAMVKLKPVE